MLTVSCKGQHEKVNCSEEEIVLSGPPSNLTGYITFQNQEKEDIFIRDLPLNPKGKTRSVTSQSLDINTMLSPQQVKSHFTSHSMNPDTPPGTYESVLTVGGKDRKVRMIVQEVMDIVLIPEQVIFMGIEPEKVHRKEILLVNRGNIPVVVPNIKHNTTIDMDLICRNLSLALRETGEQGTVETLDYFIKGLKKDVAGWVEVSIQQAGELVQPGETKVLELFCKLPKDINEQRMYEGDIRILDKELYYQIIPAANPRKTTKKTESK
ncbi:MAG: hypothetical protein R3B93_25780 [Bacteroidia bacterium]